MFLLRFNSKGAIGSERTGGELHKLKDISVFSGLPKPCMQEGDWRCPYSLSESIENVIRWECHKRGWALPEIEREISEVNSMKKDKTHMHWHANENPWNTIEDFQRTPWYRRYRPNNASGVQFVSIELIKILEETVIPPSVRHDPYCKMRRRHFEDHWFNERYGPDQAKHITREQLAKQTPGMPQYGKVTRKSFIEFEAEWKKNNQGVETAKHEVYNLWLDSQKSKS